MSKALTIIGTAFLAVALVIDYAETGEVGWLPILGACLCFLGAFYPFKRM